MKRENIKRGKEIDNRIDDIDRIIEHIEKCEKQDIDKNGKGCFSKTAIIKYDAIKGAKLNVFVDAKKRIVAFDFKAYNPEMTVISHSFLNTTGIIKKYGWKESEYAGRWPIHEPDDVVGMPYIELKRDRP